MKIWINKANENWIADRIRKEFMESESDSVTNNIDCADVVWMLCPWLWRYISPTDLNNKKVVCTIHHIDTSKFDVMDFMERDTIVDCYHVPCDITKAEVAKIAIIAITMISSIRVKAFLCLV